MKWNGKHLCIKVYGNTEYKNTNLSVLVKKHQYFSSSPRIFLAQTKLCDWSSPLRMHGAEQNQAPQESILSSVPPPLAQPRWTQYWAKEDKIEFIGKEAGSLSGAC